MAKPVLDIWYPYPKGTGPSQRFRIEQYLPYLEEKFEVRIFPFWSENAWRILYRKGHFLQKLRYLLAGIGRRKLAIVKARSAKFVYIHREAAPVGGPFFEWILTRLMGKKLIYDFDDAIWLPNQSEANRKMVKHVKTHGKVGKICRMAWKVSVCNDFLADYVLRFRSEVVLIPTTIDTENHHNPALYPLMHNPIPVIGWTGSHSTLGQLDLIWDALAELHREIRFEFHLISDHFPETMPRFVRRIPWQKTTEIEDLLAFDIGIMPLYSSDWEKGKCGFKLLQYMALTIPVAASATGMNTRIVENGKEGFLVKNGTKEWIRSLRKLLLDETLRKKMGAAGRQKIKRVYSVNANRTTVMGLFETGNQAGGTARL